MNGLTGFMRRLSAPAMARRGMCAAALAFAMAGGVPCRAQLSSKDLKAASQLIQGQLYLRIDLPCHYYHAGLGGLSVMEVVRSARVTVDPLVEVSPAGVRAHSARPDHLAENVFWRFGPNDPVRYGKLHSDNGAIEVSVEGLPPNLHEVKARFVGIKTLADFQAAFDLTFSRVPLQDEHPEWPPEIRKAIAERRAIPGMTPEQAYCVFGDPVEAEEREEGGRKLETWFPRQAVHQNADPKLMLPSGFPQSLKFVDGKLTQIGEKVKLEPLAKYPEDLLQQARNMVVKKQLYMRIDLPSRLYPQLGPVVEVSPEGATIPSAPEYYSDVIYWKLRPNDTVTMTEVVQSGGAIEIRKPGGRWKFAVLFVGINSIADFQAAFDQTFSTVPLQEEHADWPADIRQGIAERYVLDGMTPDQVYCVTGEPARTETGEENGAKFEVWYPREKVRAGRAAGASDSPLRFVEGKLTLAERPPGKRR